MQASTDFTEERSLRASLIRITVYCRDDSIDNSNLASGFADEF